MRLTSIVLLLGSGWACTSTPVAATPGAIPPSSRALTLERAGDIGLIEGHGVALVADGRFAHLGMLGNTCRMAVGSSAIDLDENVVRGDDTVVDADGDDVVVIDPDRGVVVLEGNPWDLTPSHEPEDSAADTSQSGTVGPPYGDSHDHPQPGAIDARAWANGLVILTAKGGQCTLVWDELGAQVPVDARACGGDVDFKVDRASGTAWLAYGEVWRVTPARASMVAQGDRVAHDAESDTVLVASAGATTIDAFGADGAPRWSRELGEHVTALASLPGRGAFAILLSGDYTNDLLVLDATDGTRLMLEPMRWWATLTNLSVSADGSTVAAWGGDYAQFARLSGTSAL